MIGADTRVVAGSFTLSPTVLNLVTLVGTILTIIALSVAWYQVRQAREQSKDLSRHEASLGQIASSLSTRYLSVFPEYLTTVIDVIDRATDEITIVTGNATPAVFTHPLLWLDYYRAIQRKIYSGVTVTMISMTKKQRLMRVVDEFDLSDSEWSDWCKQNELILRNYLRQRCPDIDPSQLTPKRFQELLVETQDLLTLELFGLAATYEVDSIIPVHIWVVDDNEAVFSIETLKEESLSHGLYTSDAKFVAALKGMASLYRYVDSTQRHPSVVGTKASGNDVERTPSESPRTDHPSVQMSVEAHVLEEPEKEASP